MTADFDAETYKETTREQWQAADAWLRWHSTLQEWLGPTTNALMDMAGIGSGDHVSKSRPEPGNKAFRLRSGLEQADGSLRPISPPMSSPWPPERPRRPVSPTWKREGGTRSNSIFRMPRSMR